MPSITSPNTGPDPIKAILISKPGDGKTGAKAALVAAGWKLRTLDIDKGIGVLRGLLTDNVHYPYADYMRKHNIDPNLTTSYIPIDQDMEIRARSLEIKDINGRVLKTETTKNIVPSNTQGWSKMLDALYDWNDGENKHGNIALWDKDTILDIDTFSTASQFAYYSVQGVNNRLGEQEDGYDHQRDVGGSQRHLRRLLERLFSSTVKCNVIINCHISWIDEGQGFAQTPAERARQNKLSVPDGLPDCIGQALSPKMAKYFTNIWVVRKAGNLQSVKRTIYTVPVDRIIARRSAWLQDQYDISTGLAEIFSTLSGKPLPPNFIEELQQKKPPPPTPQSQSPRPLTPLPTNLQPLKPRGATM